MLAPLSSAAAPATICHTMTSLEASVLTCLETEFLAFSWSEFSFSLQFRVWHHHLKRARSTRLATGAGVLRDAASDVGGYVWKCIHSYDHY